MVAKAFSSNIALPNDPDVKIPLGVKAAAAKADAAFRAAYPDQVPSNTTSAEANPPEPAAGEPAGGSEPSSSPQSKGNESPAPSEFGSGVQPAPVSSERGQDVNWEHRFNSMKGRHDKAQDSIKQMAEQINN